jgi:hypothetical protein
MLLEPRMKDTRKGSRVRVSSISFLGFEFVSDFVFRFSDSVRRKSAFLMQLASD